METPEPSNPQKRQWSWQYSVSTLLVVVTILSVGLAVVRHRAERQRQVVAAVRESGGSVRYDFEPDDGTTGAPPGPDWLYWSLGVDYFADVVHVHALGMTDATCSDLSALTSLRWLYLHETQITDAGLPMPAFRIWPV